MAVVASGRWMVDGETGETLGVFQTEELCEKACAARNAAEARGECGGQKTSLDGVREQERLGRGGFDGELEEGL